MIIEKLVNKPLSNIVCDVCGCSGIHACMGQRVIWTPEKIKEFYDVLSQYEVEKD